MIVRALLAFLLGLLASHGLQTSSWPWLSLLAWGLYAAWMWPPTCLGTTIRLATAFGLGLYAPQTLWVAQTLAHRVGGNLWSAALGWAIVLGFVVGLGVLAGVVWQSIRHRNGLLAALQWGAAHAGVEWLRSLPFQGEPLPGLGHAWVDTLLAGWVPYLGVNGLSWLLYSGVALLAWAIGSAQQPVKHAAGVTLGLVLLAALGTALPDPVQAHGPPVSFRLVALPAKDQPQHRLTRELFEASKPATPRLLITPESALPVAAHDIDSRQWQTWQTQAQRTGSHLLLGLPVSSAMGRHNSLLMVGPDGVQVQHKHLLMPWGEYTPSGWAWLNPWLHIPAATDLTAGAWIQAPLSVKPSQADEPAIALGSLICQEEANSASLQRWLPQAHLLINTANLQWFSGTGLSEQRMRMAQARALESGRPILRAAHAAPDAHIDHRGRLVALQPNDHLDLSGEVQPMQGHTPYLRWVQAWLPGCWGLLLLGWRWPVRRRVAPLAFAPVQNDQSKISLNHDLRLRP